MLAAFKVLFAWLWTLLGGKRGRTRVRRRRKVAPTGNVEYDAFVERQCGQKVRHGSEGEARIHAAEMQKKTGEAFNTYRCKVCGSFHVGHRR